MNTPSNALTFLLTVARVEAMLTRRFDSMLGGLGMSDFLILHHLSQAPDQKMRRIDLAERVGLTASGITRLLAPMEKIGLVKREAHEHDARVSFVTLAPGGKTKLTEALERAELFCEEKFPDTTIKSLTALTALLTEIGEAI